LFFLFGSQHEAGYQSIGDGGAYPDFGKEIFGVFVGRLKNYGNVIEYGNDHVDDINHPQPELGIGFPFLAGIEKSNHEEQRHREDEAPKVERIKGQLRRKEDVAKQYRDAHTQGTPIVELIGFESVEEKHPHHHYTSNVEQVEDEFGPSLFQSEMEDAINHGAHREHDGQGSNHDINGFGSLFESC
jgi:hypothetical protein